MTIKEARRKNGMTQEELAEKIAVKRSTVAMWEKGINKPRAATLILLARVLRCTPNDLLGFETPEETRAEIIARRMTEAREGSEG